MKGSLKNSRLLYFVLGAVIVFGIMSARIEQIRRETADAVAYYPAIYNSSEAPDEEDGYIHSFPEGSVVRYDLDGDGHGEDITLDIYNDATSYLTIGDSIVQVESCSPTGYFSVLNVYPYMSDMLVAVSDYGPSDDFQTMFYAYDGNRIKEVGYINDIIGQNIYGRAGATCYGDGTITAQKRWNVLGSWNTLGTYYVSEGGVMDVTDFYSFYDWDGNRSVWEVWAKEDILTYGNTEDPEMETLLTVPAGTVMRMIGLQTTESEYSFWVAFEVNKLGTRWVPVEIIEWESYVHTGIGFINSQQAFDGFFYAG